jgi:hypothetical protein
MENKLTTKQAIEHVLGGKTPKQVFYSVLYGENKKAAG